MNAKEGALIEVYITGAPFFSWVGGDLYVGTKYQPDPVTPMSGKAIRPLQEKQTFLHDMDRFWAECVIFTDFCMIKSSAIYTHHLLFDKNVAKEETPTEQ